MVYPLLRRVTTQGREARGLARSVWFIIYHFLSPFCFLLIEFHDYFSISYKIYPYFLYYCYILGNDRPLGLLFFIPTPYTSFHSQASHFLPSFSDLLCYFILAVPMRAWVFWKALVHEFHIYNSLPNGTCSFFAKRGDPCVGQRFTCLN